MITSETMEGQRLIFVNLLILLFGSSSPERCDRATTARVQEGNIGQSEVFNWLGVLSVHLHDDDGKVRMAMTGIVLIKLNYALANADDIVRIPRNVFESDSRAMFLPAKDTPWFMKPASYVTHPEYESYTLNSIALIEFNINEVYDFPLNPICLPSGERYNTSKYLYLTGFTDENQLMEKVIYNIQYMGKTVCEEFYNRAGLSSQKRMPTAYLCGYAPSNKTQCIWDNGMALVSNVTGYFYLIGFGVHGPGCAAPARFIDLFQYYYWINSVTSPDEIYDDPEALFDRDFRRKDDDEFIPAHELFTMNGSQRKGGEGVSFKFERYPFDTDNVMKYHIIRPDEDKDALHIFRFTDKWENSEEACSSSTKHLMYNEFFKLTSRPRIFGSITYKLSLYDHDYMMPFCVRLKVESESRSDAIISFKEEINFEKGTHEMETPDEILQVFTGARPMQKSKSKTDEEEIWRPDPRILRPTSINDLNVTYGKVLNCDLYIKLEFKNQATLTFQMYADERGLPNGWSGSWLDIIKTTTEPVTTDSGTTELSGVGTTEPGTGTTDPGTAPRKKLKLRLRTTPPNTVWEVDHWADKMVREDEVKLATDAEDVEETKSAARRKRPPGLVVVACWLITSFLRREFYIN